MSTRFLVTVEQGSDLDAVEKGLRAAGAESMAAPTPELPNVCIVMVAEDAEDFVGQAASVPGVEVAEPDAWPGSFDGEDMVGT